MVNGGFLPGHGRRGAVDRDVRRCGAAGVRTPEAIGPIFVVPDVTVPDFALVEHVRIEPRGNKKEATAGFEPAIGVLQTPALPLGHVA